MKLPSWSLVRCRYVDDNWGLLLVLLWLLTRLLLGHWFGHWFGWCILCNGKGQGNRIGIDSRVHRFHCT